MGIASLIAAAICRACSLLGTLGALGLWLLTVIAGMPPLTDSKLAALSVIIVCPLFCGIVQSGLFA